MFKSPAIKPKVENGAKKSGIFRLYQGNCRPEQRERKEEGTFIVIELVFCSRVYLLVF